MIRIFTILFYFLLFLSCKETTSKYEKDNDLGDDSVSYVDEDSIILNSNKVADFINEKEYTDNPDTTLAIYLFKDYKSLNFDDSFEELVRWELEHAKIGAIIKGMYGKNPKFEVISDSLEKYRTEFIAYTRKILLNDYNDFMVLTGPPLDFLFLIRDSLTIDLMKRALENPDFPKDEKVEVKTKLKQID